MAAEAAEVLAEAAEVEVAAKVMAEVLVAGGAEGVVDMSQKQEGVLCRARMQDRAQLQQARTSLGP